MYQDLTTFTEVDSLSHWSQNVTQNIATSLTSSESSYVYKDFTAGYFGDFEHWFNIRRTSGDTGFGGLYGVADNVNSFLGSAMASGHGIYVLFYTTWIMIQDMNSGLGDIYMSSSLDTTYYIKINRTGSDLFWAIYPTASDRTNNTNAIYSNTLNLVDTTTYRYLLSGFSYGGAGFDTINAYVENIDIDPLGSDLLEINDTLNLVESTSFMGDVVESETSNLLDTVAIFENKYIDNTISTWAILLNYIDNKINTVIVTIENIANYFSTYLSSLYNIDNRFDTHRLELSDISNRFGMLADFQVPGEVGIQSLGKTYIKVYINSIEQTDVDIDSINITKTLNSAHVANFNLARAYDNTKPSIDSTIEIKYHNWSLYSGYITSVTPGDSPESIQINCEDEYYKQNKAKKYYLVGHRPQDNLELYYYSIAQALYYQHDWNLSIGEFIPQTLNNFGIGQSDAITTLINECGNYGWYYRTNKEKALWIGGEGDIINIEKQELDKNLKLYQVISMQFKNSVSNLVNKFRVQLGEQTIRKFTDTGGSKRYTSFSYSMNDFYVEPNWNSNYEKLSRYSTNGYGIDYPDPNNKEEYDKVFRDYKFETLSKNTEEWSNRFEPIVEIINPSISGWKCTHDVGIILEGYSIDYERGTMTFNEAVYFYKTNTYGEITNIRAPIVKVKIGKKYYYSHTGSSSEDPATVVSNNLMFFTDKIGDFDDTIMNNLELTSFTVQQGISYKNAQGDRIVIPSWNDIPFAVDYSYWLLSQSADVKTQGTIALTLDAVCHYNIELFNRIMIDDVLDNSLNIVSINYNISSFLVTIELENFRPYKRTVSLQSHGE